MKKLSTDTERQIVDEGNTTTYQAIFIEFLFLVAIEPETPLFLVMPLIGKTH
ncbi:hypothetical protein JK168_04400 [Acetobacter thailandicus]|nr:hypothetical protein [Acetobacter thailandicus]